MDLNLRVIHARDFLKVTATGEVEFEKSKQALANIASINSAPPSQYDILIDARHKTGYLTLTDIAELLDVMIDHRDSFRSKVAILTQPGEDFDKAKFAELYGVNRGFMVGAFIDFEEAMNFLMTFTDLTPNMTFGESNGSAGSQDDG